MTDLTDHSPPTGDIRDVGGVDPRVARLLDRASSNTWPTSAPDFVASDLPVVHAALAAVCAAALARGPVFCEWGAGSGAVTSLASLHSFEAYGIEIERDLVDAARALADELDVDATFAHGTFLLPGDEDVVADSTHLRAETSRAAYDEIGIDPEACDVVFHYPWPGEEALVDVLFVRHTTPGALLLTFHGTEQLLVQRHVGEGAETVGWF